MLTLQILIAISLLYVGLSAIHKFYLHPLRHIPGPKRWIAFPLLRHIAAVRGRFDDRMRAFHQTYGEVVRFGPDEVSFISASAWPEIYGHGSQLTKVLNSSSNPSDILSAHGADHARFRKALAPAFSAKGLQAQGPILMQYVDQLVVRLHGVAESQLSTDLVKWYNLTTFDLIGDLAFGEPFGGLQNAGWRRSLISFASSRGSKPKTALTVLLPRRLVEAQKRQREHTRITVQRRLTSTMDRRDFMDAMMRQRGEKGGLRDVELEANANILIIAGSETTATLLSGVTYWLLRTPAALQRVTQEVRSTMHGEDEITLQRVTARLPYLMACVNEGFRMYPPVPTVLQRWTPASRVMKISGYSMPPNTKVSVHQWAAYWSPTNFHAPDQFLPERWLAEAKEQPESPFFSDQRQVVRPFSTGPRDCIGKNLAYSEMRVILARVLWNFDFELDRSQTGVEWHRQRTFSFWEKPPLMVRIQRVVREEDEQYLSY
ncbi:hypothetical protein FE257_003601 [Aspergillus nanangensis]|uniref:Cytochrome P450 n=1 Tax=Aspergillus nanangensis TaxID=2582783 RepID=A0AAD4CRX2_ASPNN|nr:hypothetical protein FE257_003601 [Aspergillus nanangensis]